ncbi:hypothetical protein EDD99_3492 [Streptomyces sp. 846.5]|nr:VOC family protein [Streptomyces sp. 846.5]TDU05007.1 hypothetical protein EDD99_3492 [Streptomyces sp. 846.5]
MPLGLQRVVFQSPDPVRLSKFWSAALQEPVEPGGGDGITVGLGGSRRPTELLLADASAGAGLPVPRIVLQPRGATLPDEVRRLTSLGAKVVHKRHRGWGSGEVLMADPEGNTFLVVSSAEEVDEAEARIETHERGQGGPFWQDIEVDGAHSRVTFGVSMTGD